MAINPDNFIFHSDFWYPTGYLSGTKDYVNVSSPATFTMSDQYEDGDFYSVWLEYPTKSTIGERYLSDTIINFTALRAKTLAADVWVSMRSAAFFIPER